MDWVKKLQRERSHIATITMNPKFMFLTSIVVVGDHNYRKPNQGQVQNMYVFKVACKEANNALLAMCFTQLP